jgi:hypothetical protein
VAVRVRGLVSPRERGQGRQGRARLTRSGSPGGTGTGTDTDTIAHLPYRQRLSGLGRIDAGDVGWRGCSVDGHDSGVMDEGGQKKRAINPPGWPGVLRLRRPWALGDSLAGSLAGAAGT